MRESRKKRKTNETDIELYLNLDGTGKSDIDTGVGFFDHMLDLFTKHGSFDLTLKAVGDNADNHHVIEDIGITLGQAFHEALGDKRGITRYADMHMPMDESLTLVAVDISGRPYLVCDVPLTREFIGEFETELLEEFLTAFAMNSKMTLHVRTEYGTNNHHMVEGIFKGLGRVLKEAVEVKDPDAGIPSTKGVLE